MSNKSIVVSLRIKPWTLAKAIDGLRTYEKAFYPDKISEIVRKTYEHGINYLTMGLPLEPTIESQDIISLLTQQNQKPKIRQESIIGSPIPEHMRRKIGNRTPPTMLPKQSSVTEAEMEQIYDDYMKQKKATLRQTSHYDNPHAEQPIDLTQQKGSPLYEDIDTGSEKSVVTDFSVPKELLTDNKNESGETD